MGTRHSLVLITVDCLRADHVGFLGYDRPTTPFLDSLATESIVCSNAVAAGAPTYYSFPAILASRYPLALGRDVIGLAPDEPTIASVLNQSGYATAAFLAGNPYLSRRFGYDCGFDTFRDFLDNEAVVPAGETGEPRGRTRWNRLLAATCHRLGPLGALYDELYFQYCQRVASTPVESLDALRRYPPADAIVDHASEWLAGIGGAPFFLWLHFMDPHAPYYPPEEALELMGNGKRSAARARYLNSYWNRAELGTGRLRHHRKEVVQLYDAGIRWVDTQIGRLTDRLRHMRLWESCVVAVTADHGEEFLDHDGRYHRPTVTEEIVHVPLLIRAPGIAATKTAESPFGLLHLAPTLMDALGVPAPKGFCGQSYWPQMNAGQGWSESAIMECVAGCTNPFRPEKRLGARVLAIREARYKLVLDFSASNEALFDLQTDPGELRPVSPDEEKPVRRRLLDSARRHLADSLRSRDSDQRLHMRLRDLRLEWANPGNRIST